MKFRCLYKNNLVEKFQMIIYIKKGISHLLETDQPDNVSTKKLEFPLENALNKKRNH